MRCRRCTSDRAGYMGLCTSCRVATTYQPAEFPKCVTCGLGRGLAGLGDECFECYKERKETK